jgi:hypothetical protein
MPSNTKNKIEVSKELMLKALKLMYTAKAMATI